MRRWLGLVLTILVVLAPARASAFKLGRPKGEPVRATIVEGTSGKGGVQPDFLVDEEKDEALHGLLERARAIGEGGGGREERVRAVYDLVRRSLTWAHGGAPTDYEDPGFRRLLAAYRSAGRPIPLGEYARHGLGDCRAHFLVLHLALLKAGIDNEAVYASIHGGPVSQEPSAREGHGFVVLRGGGDDGRVLDSYYAPFNGARLKDLESARGVPRTDGRGERLQVLAVRPYPRVLAAVPVDARPITWAPRPAQPRAFTWAPRTVAFASPRPRLPPPTLPAPIARAPLPAPSAVTRTVTPPRPR